MSGQAVLHRSLPMPGRRNQDINADMWSRKVRAIGNLIVDQREMQSRALGRWIAHYTGECSTKEQISK
jgi:hypothetical protein